MNERTVGSVRSLPLLDHARYRNGMVDFDAHRIRAMKPAAEPEDPAPSGAEHDEPGPAA